MDLERTDLDPDIESSGHSDNTVRTFFKSGWSNLVRLMGANALFVLFNIPAIAIAYFFAVVFIPMMSTAMHWDVFITVVEDGNTVISLQLYSLLVMYFVMALVSTCLVCVGPFQTGFVQVYRNIKDGVSISLLHDFKQGLKKNVGKSIAAMVIGIVISAILILAVSFYLNLASTVGTVIACVFAVLFFAFILVQNFVYNLMVATDLSLFKIYKNAILFVLIRFGPCLGVALLVVIFYFAVPFFLLMSASYTTLGIYLFLYSFVVVSWMQYFMAYYTDRLIDKYVAAKS